LSRITEKQSIKEKNINNYKKTKEGGSITITVLKYSALSLEKKHVSC
jgi:hypothetical protein